MARRHWKKRVDQLERPQSFEVKIDGKTIVCPAPTREKIDQAIENNELEPRPFQKCEKVLVEEWKRLPEVDRAGAIARYHSQRVAFLCVNGWDKPIEFCSHGRRQDGAHRLLAAHHLKLETIDCERAPCRCDRTAK